MKDLTNYLRDRFPVDGDKKGGPNSERADVVDQLMKFMGEDPHDSKRFKYWLGRTKKLSPGDIYRLMREARDGKNAPALFNYKLKQYGKK